MSCRARQVRHAYRTLTRCPLGSYGYQTNTRIKFVLAIALADAVIRDVDVRTVSITYARAEDLLGRQK